MEQICQCPLYGPEDWLSPSLSRPSHGQLAVDESESDQRLLNKQFSLNQCPPVTHSLCFRLLDAYLQNKHVVASRPSSTHPAIAMPVFPSIQAGVSRIKPSKWCRWHFPHSSSSVVALLCGKRFYYRWLPDLYGITLATARALGTNPCPEHDSIAVAKRNLLETSIFEETLVMI